MIPKCASVELNDGGLYVCTFCSPTRHLVVEIEAPDANIASARALQIAMPELAETWNPGTGNAQLEAIYEAKFLEIDCGTDFLVERGFQFPQGTGAQYSLSLESQMRMNALFALYNTHLTQKAQNVPVSLLEQQFPLTYNSLDDFTTLTLDSAEAVASFCLTAFGTLAHILGTGTQVKQALRVAKANGAQPAQVAAFVDPRFT